MVIKDALLCMHPAAPAAALLAAGSCCPSACMAAVLPGQRVDCLGALNAGALIIGAEAHTAALNAVRVRFRLVPGQGRAGQRASCWAAGPLSGCCLLEVGAGAEALASPVWLSEVMCMRG